MFTAIMRKPLAILILGLLQSSLAVSTLPDASKHQTSGSKEKDPPVYADDEGYKLMSLVLDSEANLSKEKRLELYERSDEVGPLTFCKALPEDFQSAADDLSMRSKTKVRFKKKFSLARAYRLIRDDSINGLGITVVGFDPDRTHAVVAVQGACGVMCGGGSTYLLRKTEKGWKIVDRVCEWMS
jgi:hypothetical protein